jgi:hypothetical protein
MTTDDRFAVLSALIDREPVDPNVLASALEDPAARAQLVDFVRLRESVHRELAVDDGVEAAVRSTGHSTLKLWIARAALVLLPLTLGATAGAWFVERQATRPPAPDRIVQFVPGVDWK